MAQLLCAVAEKKFNICFVTETWRVWLFVCSTLINYWTICMYCVYFSQKAADLHSEDNSCFFILNHSISLITTLPLMWSFALVDSYISINFECWDSSRSKEKTAEHITYIQVTHKRTLFHWTCDQLLTAHIHFLELLVAHCLPLEIL